MRKIIKDTNFFGVWFSIIRRWNIKSTILKQWNQIERTRFSSIGAYNIQLNIKRFFSKEIVTRPIHYELLRLRTQIIMYLIALYFAVLTE